MKNEIKKILAILLAVCMILPSMSWKAEATGEGVSGKTRTQFITNNGYNADTGDFGKTQFDGKDINSIMGTSGYAYLFHTKLRSSADAMSAFDAAKNPYMQIKYEGYGTAAEQYYIELYKSGESWALKYKLGAQTLNEYILADKQIAEITGTGLDIFLVNSDSNIFTVFVEKDGVIDTMGSLMSPKNNKQVYRVTHTSKDTVATFTTTGYFYGSGFTRATAAQTLEGMEVTPVITKEEAVAVNGVKESYQVGEVVAFLAPTFSFLEHKNGGHIQQIGATDFNDFGSLGNNFIFHTKVKCPSMVDTQGIIQYPESEITYAVIRYVGWASSKYSWNSYSIMLKMSAGSATITFAGEDNWNTTPMTLSEAQIRKCAEDGLDLFFVHSKK